MSKTEREIKIKCVEDMHKIILTKASEMVKSQWLREYVANATKQADIEYIVDNNEFWVMTCEFFGKFYERELAI